MFEERMHRLQARAAAEIKNRPVFELPHEKPPKIELKQAVRNIQKSARATSSERLKNLISKTKVDPGDYLAVNKLLLPNGMTVIHKSDTSAPLLSMIFSYHVGSRMENKKNQGVAHLLEHMMFKGTHQRPLQWGRLFDVIGSATNAFTTYGMTAYFHTVHKTALEPLLQLEADRMKNLTLFEEQFIKEKQVVMSELTADRNTPLRRLMEKTMAAAYPTSWPGRSVGGVTVMDLTRDDANEFYIKGYRPGCATLTVVGDVAWADLLDKLLDAGLVDLGMQNMYEWSPCEFDIEPPVAVTMQPGFDPSKTHDHKVLMSEVDADGAYLLYVIPLCNMTVLDDVASLTIIESLLNGMWLPAAVSEIPNAEAAAGAFFEEDSGWLLVMGLVAGGTFNDLLVLDDKLSGNGGLFEAIRGIGDEPSLVSAPDVAIAVSHVVDSQRRQWFASIDEMAVHLAVDQTLTNDHMYTQRLLNVTKHLTANDVIRVANKYFVKQNFIVGTYAPGTEADAAATEAKYGGVDKFTEHESVNNTEAYYQSIQCHIPTAEAVLTYVAELKYEGNHTVDLPGGESRGTSLPIAPPLCFDDADKCPIPTSFRPARPMYLKLKNGMQLLAHTDEWLQDSDESVVMGYIDAGMEYDPVDYEGTSMLAGLTMQLNLQMYMTTAQLADLYGEEAVAKDNLPPDAAAHLDSMGEIVIAPQLEGMLIQGFADCSGLDSVLQALHHTLTNSVMLSSAEHQQLQTLVGDMVESMASDPSYDMQQSIFSEIYPPQHPRIRRVTRDSVRRVPLELVTKFYINRVCPEHVKLAVVSPAGSGDALGTINRMAQLFERWPSCASRRFLANSTLPQPSLQNAARAATSQRQGLQEKTPLQHVAELFKHATGSSDEDIEKSEVKALNLLNKAEQTVKVSMNHGATLVSNAVSRLVGAADASPMFQDVVVQTKDAMQNKALGQSILNALNPNIQTSLLEEEQIEGGLPSSPPPDLLHGLPSELFDGMAVPQAPSVAELQRENEARVKAQHILAYEQRFAKDAKHVLSDAGALLLETVFNQHTSTLAEQIFMGGDGGPRDLLSIFMPGGFRSLNNLLNMKRNVEDMLKPAAAPGKNGALPGVLSKASALEALVGSHTHRKAGKLSKVLSGLRRSSHGNDEELGLIERPRIRSVDDMGSVLALSWSDITRNLHPIKSRGVSRDQPSVLATALATLLDNVNQKIISQSTPLTRKFSKRQTYVPASLNEIENQLYHKVEEQMNHLRAQLDKFTQTHMPQVLVQKLSQVTRHPPHMPTLHRLNQELSQEISALQRKLPEINAQLPQNALEGTAMLTSIESTLHALQPELQRLGQIPLRLVSDLDDEEGAEETPKVDPIVEASVNGTNSQPEPTSGGAMGMFELPSIPATPLYPPPKPRNGIVWIKRKVPGLHEAITMMVTDTLTHRDKDYVPALVANHILGGNSLSGKLGYWVRDCKGLTYHVASALDVSRHSGLFAVKMQTQTGPAMDQAVNDTLNILQDVRYNGFTESELNAAKRSLISMANIQAADPRGVVERIMMDMVHATDDFGGIADTNMWTSLTQHIMDLEVSDLNRAAAGVFQATKLVIVSLAENLEDDYYPNHELDGDYLTPPPPGTQPPHGGDGGCEPRDDDGNPYRTGEPELYVPPVHVAAKQLTEPALQPPLDLLGSVSHNRPHHHDDHQQNQIPAALFAPPPAEMEFSANPEVQQLHDNVKRLAQLGSTYTNALTGGMLDKMNKVGSVVRAQLEQHHPTVARAADSPNDFLNLVKSVVVQNKSAKH
eukprot:c10981_g1_i1.p1 GENE.c10981_g1_i1~~c10981_g1_i1.p1  ORF type:complete len:1816 (+),score=433.29 c10981_g1_i1:113-5449(+)